MFQQFWDWNQVEEMEVTGMTISSGQMKDITIQYCSRTRRNKGQERLFDNREMSLYFSLPITQSFYAFFMSGHTGGYINFWIGISKTTTEHTIKGNRE